MDNVNDKLKPNEKGGPWIVEKLKRVLIVMWEGSVGGLIRKSPGFLKKELSCYKLDLSALCAHGCLYCSSNWGNFMRIHAHLIEEWAKRQLGFVLNPMKDAFRFAIYYEDPIKNIKQQLLMSPSLKFKRAVLQFGMLVDNFDPYLVKTGVTLAALKILFEETQFTIRILTKSIAVARPEFVELFKQYPGRVTVGMSCGSMDDNRMKAVELFTSLPSSRAKAIRDLQAAGVSTFGMFCPVLPGYEDLEQVRELYSAFNIYNCDTVWAEPFNDRNWRYMYDHLTDDFIKSNLKRVMEDPREWAKYALSLATNHATVLDEMGYSGKSIFLLYEDGLKDRELDTAKTIPGVLFQSDPNLNCGREASTSS